MRSINVLHIETGRNLYGGAAQVQYLLQGLRQYPINNFLLCTPNAAVGQNISDCATVIERAMKGDLDIASIGKIKHIVRKNDIHIVHAHSRKGADLWGLIAAKQAGVASVITRRVDNTEPAWFAKLKYNNASAVVSISKGIEKVLLAEGVKPERLRTIRSVVDTEKFTVTPNGQYWESEWGYRSDDIVVGVVAQLIQRKGHRYLFEVLPTLKTEFPRLKVLVLGKGPIEADLKAQVNALNLDDIVSFGGFREDIEKILPNFYLVVHPAEKEGLGVALLQAAACGVPVIGARAGGIPEAVSHQQHGLTFDVGDTQALYGHLRDMLQNRGKRDEYARNGRARMVQEFSIAAMASDYVELYQALASDTNG